MEYPGHPFPRARLAGISACAVDVPTDGASLERQHEPLAALAGRASTGVVLRDFSRTRRRAWSTEHGMDLNNNTPRFDSSQGIGHPANPALQPEGAHRPSRRLALALRL